MVAELLGSRGSFAIRHFSNGCEGCEKLMKSPKYVQNIYFRYKKLIDMYMIEQVAWNKIQK